MNEYDNIRDMTPEERTERYITHRTAELRGDVYMPTLDSLTEKYITRRLTELRGELAPGKKTSEHPYVRRRLAELRRKTNET